MRRRRWPARRPATIRGRLTLLAVLVALVPLTAGAVAAAVSVRNHLVRAAGEEVDKTVRAYEADVAGTRQDTDEKWRRTRLELLPRAPQLKVSTYPLEGERLWYREIDHPVPDAALSLVPWTDPASREPLHRTGPRVAPGYYARYILVSNPLRAEQRRLNTVVWSLAGGVVAVTALVAGTTWVVAGRVLRPVEAIRTQFAELTAHHLDRRVPVPRTRDEVSRLAQTMNTTLDRLQEAVDQQRRFVGDASHELRSPLATLRTELEIALAHPDRADWAEVVAAALGDARRLQELTADLLLLARLDAAGGPGLPGGRPVDLAALVREETARRRPPGRPALRVETGSGPVPVHGHRALLARLLGNLLDNADRHAEREVRVRLVRDEPGGLAVVHVRDDGPGIAPVDRRRVFERFTRLDDARARDTGGTGLGLAIARRIAEAHRGTVEIADSHRGAHFTVTLPTVP
ncbi:ATP-binding protein [Streptomyces sp. NPDC046261]|uniref:sensor histidine kinase n=1 Tax=Streptomyces sp. NPDC046261 TaxID=3157200 RepID=UPI0033D71E91